MSATIANTLGAAFLGNLCAAVLYGVTCVQTFIYYQSFAEDGRALKATVASLWLLDTLHIVLISHAIYFYAVTNFMNPAALADPTMTIMVHIIVTCFSDGIVRYVFARRIWILSGKSKILMLAIAVTSIIVFAGGIAFVGRAIPLKSFANFAKIGWIMYMSLGCGMVADGLIAISLCVILSRKRTGYKQSDSLVNVLMIYGINTGLLTGVCAAGTFILFAVQPHNYIFLGVYFCLSKLYLNSLLATLNARIRLREQRTTGGDVISLPLSTIPGGQKNSIMDSRHQQSERPKMVVNVETTWDIKSDQRQESDDGHKV